MRKLIGILLMAIMVLPLLSGCGVPQDEHDAVVDERDEAQSQIASLQGDLAEAQSQIEAIESDLAAAQSQVQALQHDYDRIKNEVLEMIEESDLRNPTWEELREFLLLEDTDKLHYDKDSFDCTGFAITVRDHAQEYGIRCAFVEVSFTAGEGHAFNAFETTDKGLIYVDNVGGDKIAYVQLNQPYGTIHLDGVKSEYIACSVDPDEFWTPLTYDTHTNLFSYDYYTDYQSRLDFYDETAAAYNQAVADYNPGSTRWSYSDIQAWIANLEALEEDLGSDFYEAGQVVRNLEIYWN